MIRSLRSKRDTTVSLRLVSVDREETSEYRFHPFSLERRWSAIGCGEELRGDLCVPDETIDVSQRLATESGVSHFAARSVHL